MSQPTDKLSELSRRVTQEGATEQPFTGPLLDEKRDGTYSCVVCGEPLFSSIRKFDSGSGWPSFTCPIGDGSVAEHEDHSLGMKRTEVKCTQCDAHLGHVFEDGPKDETGLRYCINSAALEFTPA